MEVYDLVKQILIEQNESAATVLEIFKTGSQLFVEHPNDLDFVAVVDKYSIGRTRQHSTHDGVVYDVIIIDKKLLASQIDFEDDYIGMNMKLFNYLYHKNIRETVYGYYNIRWNFLAYKQRYLEYLRERYATSVGKLQNKTKLTKMFVHYYIILKIFENNKIEITKEIRDNVRILYQGGTAVLPLVAWIEEKLS